MTSAENNIKMLLLLWGFLYGAFFGWGLRTIYNIERNIRRRKP
jgi:hypothetical protein